MKPGDLIHGPGYSHNPQVRLIIREYTPVEGMYFNKVCYEMLESDTKKITWPKENIRYHWKVVE